MSADTDKRGGLPEDDALGAFAAGALPPRRRRNPSPDRTPDPDPNPAAGGPPPEEADQAEAAQAADTQGPPVGTTVDEYKPAPLPEPRRKTERGYLPSPSGIAPQTTGNALRSTQCTIMVSVSVRDRFAAYQLAKKLERGTEPTNAVVVRRAVLHARRNDLFAQMLQYVRHRQQPTDDEDDDPDGVFGDVRGRRTERGRTKDSQQQSFRPSYQELAVIDTLTEAYGFENRSEFLDACLDTFLPPLPDKRRRP